jgi:hypothetical protein
MLRGKLEIVEDLMSDHTCENTQLKFMVDELQGEVKLRDIKIEQIENTTKELEKRLRLESTRKKGHIEHANLAPGGRLHDCVGSHTCFDDYECVEDFLECMNYLDHGRGDGGGGIFDGLVRCSKISFEERKGESERSDVKPRQNRRAVDWKT